MDDKIELHIFGLSKHNQTDAYALVLADEENKNRLPIVIGLPEAQAIALEMEKIAPPRPLTHDLFIAIAKHFGITEIEVLIYDLRDGIFYSKLICRSADDCIEIDARTSDAIAIALRNRGLYKINAYRHVLDDAGIIIENREDHKSDRPDKQYFSKSEKELKEMLNDAIESEDYELASKIRDEIKLRHRQTDD